MAWLGAAYAQEPSGYKYFPHTVQGDGNSTRILLLNDSYHRVTGSVRFRTQAGALEEEIPYSLAPWATTDLTTTPDGALATLSTTFENNATGVQVFDVLGKHVTVRASHALTTQRVYVSERQGEHTAIASFNPNDHATIETIKLYDGTTGAITHEKSFPLGSLEKRSRFLREEFPTLPADYEGTAEITSDDGLAAVSLIQRATGDLLAAGTTTPVTTKPQSLDERVTYLAHTVSGGDTTTRLILTNPTNATINGTVTLPYDAPTTLPAGLSAGPITYNFTIDEISGFKPDSQTVIRGSTLTFLSAMPVTLNSSMGTLELTPLTPSSITLPDELGTYELTCNGCPTDRDHLTITTLPTLKGNTLRYTLPPNTARSLTTTNQGPLQSGPVTITGDADASAFLNLFNKYNISQTAQPASTTFQTYASTNEKEQTGIALTNTSQKTANITYTLSDASGGIDGPYQQLHGTIAPGATIATFVNELFNNPTSKGLFSIISDQPLAGTGLIQLANGDLIAQPTTTTRYNPNDIVTLHLTTGDLALTTTLEDIANGNAGVPVIEGLPTITVNGDAKQGYTRTIRIPPGKVTLDAAHPAYRDIAVVLRQGIAGADLTYRDADPTRQTLTTTLEPGKEYDLGLMLLRDLEQWQYHVPQLTTWTGITVPAIDWDFVMTNHVIDEWATMGYGFKYSPVSNPWQAYGVNLVGGELGERTIDILFQRTQKLTEEIGGGRFGIVPGTDENYDWTARIPGTLSLVADPAFDYNSMGSDHFDKVLTWGQAGLKTFEGRIEGGMYVNGMEEVVSATTGALDPFIPRPGGGYKLLNLGIFLYDGHLAIGPDEPMSAFGKYMAGEAAQLPHLIRLYYREDQ